uniref:peptidylprolyl isomerase n=1 Tax=Strongyloides venezuelensis TaxID=75913 RepID=A0A0K0FK38_STRVS
MFKKFDILIRFIYVAILFSVLIHGEDVEENYKWIDDDGLEIKIVKPINPEKCKIKSQAGDIVEQYYKLTDKDGQTIGSNWGKKPYTFTLGTGQVIAGMDRAMTGMCIGEKRKVVIPGKLGFGVDGRDRDGIKGDQTLYYTVQLVDLFRPVPGGSFTDEDGLQITVTHKIDDDKCKKSAPGDTIHQQYTLHLEDGTFVDSSFSRNAPFIFKLGANPRQVIEGMDRAMTGMCEGERRKVVIPSKLGYGPNGRLPQIPGDATLYFDIELEKLIKKDEL